MVERFPDSKDLIQQQYESNREFQALCQDYFLCFRSLNTWKEEMKKDQELCESYSELKKILEKKILQYVYRDTIHL
ncbi:MAG: hypothetical protein ACJ75B_06220 [Flavisolibacter sp.]